MTFFFLFAWQYITENVYKTKLKAHDITPKQKKEIEVKYKSRAIKAEF